MDGTTLIDVWFIKKSKVAKMSDGYAAELIVPHTEYYAWKHSRFDVVFDIKIVWKVRHDRKEEPEFTKK